MVSQRLYERSESVVRRCKNSATRSVRSCVWQVERYNRCKRPLVPYKFSPQVVDDCSTYQSANQAFAIVVPAMPAVMIVMATAAIVLPLASIVAFAMAVAFTPVAFMCEFVVSETSLVAEASLLIQAFAVTRVIVMALLTIQFLAMVLREVLLALTMRKVVSQRRAGDRAGNKQ